MKKILLGIGLALAFFVSVFVISFLTSLYVYHYAGPISSYLLQYSDMGIVSHSLTDEESRELDTYISSQKEKSVFTDYVKLEQNPNADNRLELVFREGEKEVLNIWFSDGSGYFYGAGSDAEEDTHLIRLWITYTDSDFDIFQTRLWTSHRYNTLYAIEDLERIDFTRIFQIDLEYSDNSAAKHYKFL